MPVIVDGYMDIRNDEPRFTVQGVPSADKKRFEGLLKAAKWEQHMGCYTMTMALWNYKDLLWLFPDLQMVGNAKQWLQAVMSRSEYLLHVKQQPDIVEWKQRWYWAYPHQRVDGWFAMEVGRSFNWSDPGTGKTLSMIIPAVESKALENHGRVMVISPNSAKYNWRNEIRDAQHKIGEVYPICVYNGTESERNYCLGKWADYGGWLIINWEALRYLVELDAETRQMRHTKGKLLDLLGSRPLKMVIADESHKGKSRDAAQAKALEYLSRHTELLLEATGTPITVQPDDLFFGLKRAYPKQFNSYANFVNRYCEFETKSFVKAGQEETRRKIIGLNPEYKSELDHILATISVKRKFEDVAKDVPEKQYKVLPIDLTDEQKKLYEEAVDNWMKVVTNQYGEDELIPIPNIISQITYLRQICLDPTIVGFHVKQTPAKTQMLIDRLGELDGQPLVVMSKFAKYIRRLEVVMKAHKVPFITITGAEKPEQRHINNSLFQSGKARVALCGIDAAGVAINLTRAFNMDFTDRDWTDALNKQAEHRIRRQGQKHPQLYSIYTAEGTVDDIIEQSNELKRFFDEAVVGGAAQFTTKKLRELLRV